MSITTEAELYVIYANGAGFFTSKKRSSFSPKLEAARFYNRHCDAYNSIARNPLLGGNREKSIIIPIPVKADPKVIFKKVLKGS